MPPDPLPQSKTGQEPQRAVPPPRHLDTMSGLHPTSPGLELDHQGGRFQSPPRWEEAADEEA